MIRILSGLAGTLLTLGLFAASAIQGGNTDRSKEVCPTNYHIKHGVKFQHGYYYPGKSHKHWTKSYYSPKWKCTFHYCPSAKAWYYYHAPKKVYYPMSYIRQAPPVGGEPAPTPGPVVPAPGPAPKTGEAKAGAALTFEKDVLPILRRSCVKCHNAERKRSGLDLTTLASVKRGGDSGAAVQPGNLDDSPLYTNVVSGRMPLGGSKLPEAEIKVIRDWIRAGARGR